MYIQHRKKKYRQTTLELIFIRQQLLRNVNYYGLNMYTISDSNLRENCCKIITRVVNLSTIRYYCNIGLTNHTMQCIVSHYHSSLNQLYIKHYLQTQ